MLSNLKSRRLTLGFSGVAITLLGLMVVAYTSFSKLSEAGRWNVHTYRVLAEVQRMDASMEQMRTGARGYALLNDADNLQSWYQSKTEFDAHLKKARELTEDRPAQQERLRQIGDQLRTWNKVYIDPLLRLGRETNNPADRAMQVRRVVVGGQASLVAMRRILVDISETESALLQQRSAAEATLRGQTEKILISGGIFCVITTASLFGLLTLNIKDVLKTNALLAGEITERKEAEAALRAVARELEMAHHDNQQIMDYSLDVICTIDEAGCFSQVSRSCENIWGYARHELIGRRYIDLVLPEDIPKTNEVALAVISGQTVSNFENCYIRKDGSLVPMVWSAVWSQADRRMFCVARDNTEYKKAEVAIRNAMQEAERANLAKSEFLSRMSHELRTPMNAILGFAQILEIEELNPDQKESVSHILKGGRHLLDLINEVLDIARIEAGHLNLSREPVLVTETLQDALALVQPLAAEQGVLLHARDTGERHVLADRQRLKQVFLNVLSNAVKYNHQGGSVLVFFEEVGDQCLRIKISDTGLGIMPEDIEKLFTPFERLGATHSTIEGTGLGLVLSRRLVEAMGGMMGIESVVGQGSTVWMDLPLVEGPVERHQRTTAEPLSVENDRESSATCTVLYVEDNLSNLRLIERILKKRPGVALQSAMQGRMGLDLARKHRPSMILLDLHLPDMMGDEVLRRLQADPETREIPVVMISADATTGQIERLRAMGAVDYLTKPLDVKQFIEVLDTILRQEER